MDSAGPTTRTRTRSARPRRWPLRHPVPSTSSARLSAVLVDIGPQTIRNYLGEGEGVTTLTTRSCYGASTAGDSACFLDTAADTETVGRQVFSRGWADLGQGKALTPGAAYSITIRLGATDHVVPAGHRLALIIAGTDSGLIDPPDTRPTVTVDLARSWARLPVAGGQADVAATAAATPSRGPALDGPTASPSHPRNVRFPQG